MTIYAEIMERIITLPADFTSSCEGQRFLATVLPLTPSEIGKLKEVGMLPDNACVDDVEPGYTLAALAEKFRAVDFALEGNRRQGAAHRLY